MGGVLMILLTIALAGAAGIMLVIALLQGRRPWAMLRYLGMAGGAWAGLYALLLIRASLASSPVVLEIGEAKSFCGFYLDCHLQVAVTGVDTMRTIGRTRAAGIFYIVTVRVSSTATRATMRFARPHAVVRDAEGRSYQRDGIAEGALAVEGAPSMPMTRTIDPSESFLTTMVFDVPPDSPALRLHITDGYWIDRLVEAALIGDEDSLLHQRTTFRLEPGSMRRPRMSLR